MQTENKLYGIIKKERKSFPIMAGMPFNKKSDYKIKKVGVSIVEFTYWVNRDFPDDKMLIEEREISRKFF
jgi:hypothetical protein